MPAGGGGGGGSGTVTSISTGTGLTGGPITVTGTIALLASYQLPQSCSNTQIPQWNGATWGCANISSGSITGATTGFGLISVSGSPTLAFTLAGTSGGIPYFSSSTTWASTAALTANGVLIGGGAGIAPSAISADTTTTHALFATASAPAFRAIAAGDIPTLNQNTTGTASNVTGTVAVANGGTGLTAVTQYAVPVASAANTYKTTFAVPDCNGSSNALNFTQANLPGTDPWTCLSISTLSNPMTTLGDVIYGGAAGAVTRLAGPTTPATPFILTSTPSGGVATAPFWNITGVSGRTVSGTSDTILGSDRSTWIDYTSASSVAVTLPQSGTGGGTSSDFTKGFVYNFRAGNGVVTVTPTTSTINGLSTLTAQNQDCFIYSDNTNYLANCFDNRGIHPIPVDTGSANAYVVACPNVQTLVTGAHCIVSFANPNTTASTINVSGLGVKNLMLPGAIALTSGAILGTPAPYPITYDGTEWVLLTNSLSPPSLPSAVKGQHPESTTTGTTYTATYPGCIDAAAYMATPYNPTPENEDIGLTLHNAIIAATTSSNLSGTYCIDARSIVPSVSTSGVNYLYANSDPWSGLGTNITPDIYFPNAYILTSVMWSTPSSSAVYEGISGSGSSSTTLSGSGIAACNAITGPGATTGCGPNNYPLYDTSTTCASGSVNCVPATGPFTLAAVYSTGTVDITNTGAAACGAANGNKVVCASNAGTTLTAAMVGGRIITDCGAAPGNCTLPIAGGAGSFGVATIKAFTANGGTLPGGGTCTPINSGTGCLTLTANFPTANCVASCTVENFLIEFPNQPVVVCDGCQGNSYRTSAFGHVWRNLAIDANGVLGAIAYYAPAVQERTQYDNVRFGFEIQQSTNHTSAIGAAAMWDYGLGDPNDPGPGHMQVAGPMQIAAGNNVLGTSSYGYIYEGWNLLLQSGTQCPSYFNLGTITGSSGNKVKDAAWIDGCVAGGVFETGHLEFFSHDGINVGPGAGAAVTSGVVIESPTSVQSSGANAVVEFQSGVTNSQARNVQSGNAICLVKDDNLGTPCLATGAGIYPQYWQSGASVDASGNVITTVGNVIGTNLRTANTVRLLGSGNLVSDATTADASYTVGNLACVTATNTVGNCGTVAANSAFIGVLIAKDGTLPVWAVNGTATVNSNASVTFTAGDYVCTDASNAGKAVDNGSTACPNPQRQVGIVKTTNTSTSHTVTLNFSAPATNATGTVTSASSLTNNSVVLGAGGQGVQTVAGFTTDGTSILTLGVAGTSVGTLAIKNATSGTITIAPPTGALVTPTLTWPITTGTLFESAGTNTGAAGAVYDFSAQTTAPSIKLPAAVGGTLLAGTVTTALSAPAVFQNTNSTNNNSSMAAIFTTPGTSTGQVTAYFNGATTGAALIKAGTGGTVASGAISGQTDVFVVQPTGYTAFGTDPACTGGTGGGWCATEGTGATGKSSTGEMWADSANHNIRWNSNNATTQGLPVSVMLTSQYTNSTTGFTNVTGTNSLAFSAAASTNYTMTCTLYYQAASTGGLNIEFTGPASPTNITYSLVDPGSATTLVQAAVATAYSTSLGAAVTTATTNFPATVTLSLQNGTNAGTVQMLAKSSAAAQLQIQSGSFCVWQSQ